MGGSAAPAAAAPSTVPPPPPSVAPQASDDEVEDDTTPAANALDFPTLVTRITAAMDAGTLTQERVGEVQKQFGLSSLFELNSKPEKIAEVAAAFGVA
jgi:hypothetical protein